MISMHMKISLVKTEDGGRNTENGKRDRDVL